MCTKIDFCFFYTLKLSDYLQFLPELCQFLSPKKTFSKSNCYLVHQSSSTNIVWSFEIPVFFPPFSRSKGSIVLLSLGDWSLTRSRLFRSPIRRSVRDRPRSEICFSNLRLPKRRWRLSSYFHGRDSACHGPLIPFFISRRVSTARERNSIHFGLPIWLSQSTLREEFDRYVFQTWLRIKCWSASKDSETHCVWCVLMRWHFR